jgi:hypothetical protein
MLVELNLQFLLAEVQFPALPKYGMFPYFGIETLATIDMNIICFEIHIAICRVVHSLYRIQK